MSTPEPESETVALGDTTNHDDVNNYLINQSDLSRHGGNNSALNEVVDFS